MNYVRQQTWAKVAIVVVVAVLAVLYLTVAGFVLPATVVLSVVAVALVLLLVRLNDRRGPHST